MIERTHFSAWTFRAGRPPATAVDFPFDEYERVADFMWRCKCRVMVSINDQPDIRRAFDGFHFECLDIRYSATNQRHGKADLTGELVIKNWEPSGLGQLS